MRLANFSPPPEGFGYLDQPRPQGRDDHWATKHYQVSKVLSRTSNLDGSKLPVEYDIKPDPWQFSPHYGAQLRPADIDFARGELCCKGR